MGEYMEDKQSKYNVEIFKRKPEPDEIIEAIYFDGTIECARFITNTLNIDNKKWKCSYEILHYYVNIGKPNIYITITDEFGECVVYVQKGEYVWVNARNLDGIFDPDIPRRIKRCHKQKYSFDKLFEKVDVNSVEEKDIIKFSDYLRGRELQEKEREYYKEHGD